MAEQLASHTVITSPTSVHIAGGGILISQGILHDVSWSVEPYTFKFDLKILPLTQFDLIIGMDWLENRSPMQIHWKFKWLQFFHEGSIVQLQGLIQETPEHLLLQLSYATIEASVPDFSAVPEDLQQLVHAYADLFAPPSGFISSQSL